MKRRWCRDLVLISKLSPAQEKAHCGPGHLFETHTHKKEAFLSVVSMFIMSILK